MVFVFDGLKYDTDKMEEIAKVQKDYPVGGMLQAMAESMYGFQHKLRRTENCTLWRSKSGKWLLTHGGDWDSHYGEPIEEAEAKELLMYQAHAKYEEIYGAMPEA